MYKGNLYNSCLLKYHALKKNPSKTCKSSLQFKQTFLTSTIPPTAKHESKKFLPLMAAFCIQLFFALQLIFNCSYHKKWWVSECVVPSHRTKCQEIRIEVFVQKCLNFHLHICHQIVLFRDKRQGCTQPLISYNTVKLAFLYNIIHCIFTAKVWRSEEQNRIEIKQFQKSILQLSKTTMKSQLISRRRKI